MKFINRCSSNFCTNIIKDKIYEFDRSAISFSVRLRSLKDFNDFQKLRELNIHRIIYNLNDQAELMDFLAEHNDANIKKIFDPSFFIFRGVNVNVPTILKDGKVRKLDHRAVLQICQHLFKLKSEENKTQFQVFLALKHDGEISNQEEFLTTLKEELDDLQSVIENSFNFEVNHVLTHSNRFSYDLLFKLANQQKTLKSVNFNIYKYANPQSSELDQNREILATLYQNANEQYNTIFLKNYIYENKYIKQHNLAEGIVSYQHLVDMMKLLHFRGSFVFDYNKNLESNVTFIDSLLQTNKYILCDKHKLGEEHESHIVEGDTMPPIDV